MKQPPPLKPFKCWAFRGMGTVSPMIVMADHELAAIALERTGQGNLIPCMCVPIKPKPKKRSWR